MSTRATESLGHTSQGDVARGDQVRGKQTQQGVHGKVASAGFAQMLGEQVAKSAPKMIADHGGEKSLPVTVPASSPNLAAGGFSQVRFEANAHALPVEVRSLPQNYQPPTKVTAAPIAAAPVADQVVKSTGNNAKQPTKQTTVETTKQPTVPSFQTSPALTAQSPRLRDTPRIDMALPVPGPAEKNRPATAPALPTKISPMAHAPAGRIDAPTAQPASRPENPVPAMRTTVAPAAASLAHTASPVSSSAPNHASVRAPMPTTNLDSPKATPNPSRSARPDHAPGSAPASTIAARVPVKPSEDTPRAFVKVSETSRPAPSKASEPAVPAPILAGNAHVLQATGENAPRVLTKTSEAATPILSKINGPVPPAPVSPKASEPAQHLPAQASRADGPAQFKASKNPTQAHAPTLPTILQATAPELPATPVSAGPKPESPATAMPIAHVPVPETIQNGPETHARKISIHGLVPIIQARSVAQPQATPPTEASSEGSHAVQKAPIKELPHPLPSAAPRAPEHQTSPRPAVDASVQTQTHAKQQAVRDPAPEPEQKSPKHPVSPQTIPATPFVSLPIPEPSPASVSQDTTKGTTNGTTNSTTNGTTNRSTPRLAQPDLAPEASHPAVTAKAVAKAAVARPATDQPQALEGTKPADPPADPGRAGTNASKPVVPATETVRPTTAPTATASANHAQAPATPNTIPVGNKRPAPVEAVAGKRRTRMAEDKEAEETTPTSPLPAQPNGHLPSHAPTSANIEFEAAKPEAPEHAPHAPSTDASSQTTSLHAATPQGHAPGQDVPTALQAPTEHPTVFVPQNVILSANHETAQTESAAPSLVAEQRAGLVDRAIEDPGLSVTVMPHSAHLSIAGDTGDLSLHVRVRDGSADVNVSGTMASLFDTKAPEVRTVLAGEGLQLGSFATDQRGSSQGQQGQPDSAPRISEPYSPPAPRRATTSTPEIQIAADRRIHVTA